MCMTLPAKILSVKHKQNSARVNLSGREIDVKMIDNNLKIRDWVLVYGDLIVNKISSKEAKKINELYNSINLCHCEPTPRLLRKS